MARIWSYVAMICALGYVASQITDYSIANVAAAMGNPIFLVVGIGGYLVGMASNVLRLHDLGKPASDMMLFFVPVVGSAAQLKICGMTAGDPHANAYGEPVGKAKYIAIENDGLSSGEIDAMLARYTPQNTPSSQTPLPSAPMPVAHSGNGFHGGSGLETAGPRKSFGKR
jgi:uncharacterized membrane protein YhaH (DUF805 family)